MESQTQTPRYALVYQSELDYVSRWVQDYPNIETGGDFFGFWTHLGNPVVQYAIGPGPEARRTVSFFNQDIDYLERCGRVLRKHHGLLHMGQWHSHHRLGISKPSSHDCDTVSSSIEESGLPRFLLTICTIQDRNGTRLNGFLFTRGQREYLPVPWVVLPGTSPIRSAIESQAPGIHHEPRTRRARMDSMDVRSLDPLLPVREKAVFPPGSWAESSTGQQTLRRVQERFAERFGRVDLSLGGDGRIHLDCRHCGALFRVTFPHDYPRSPVDILKTDPEGGRTVSTPADWAQRWNTEKQDHLNLIEECILRPD